MTLLGREAHTERHAKRQGHGFGEAVGTWRRASVFSIRSLEGWYSNGRLGSRRVEAWH